MVVQVWSSTLVTDPLTRIGPVAGIVDGVRLSMVTVSVACSAAWCAVAAAALAMGTPGASIVPTNAAATRADSSDGRGTR